MRMGWAPLMASSYERHGDFDLRAVTGAAVQVERASQPFGPLAHAQQAKMTAQSGERFLLLETAPIVFHAETQSSGFQMQPDPDFAGSRVFQNVGHGFLRYAQQ